MDDQPNILEKIFHFFQTATLERILLLLGAAFVIFGVVGEVQWSS